MQDKEYRYFKHFISCYWGEDGALSYANSSNALDAYVLFESEGYSKGLAEDLRAMLAARSFPHSQAGAKKFERLLKVPIYRVVTATEARHLLSILNDRDQRNHLSEI